MSECICSSCKNLKGVMNDEGMVEEFDCEFGFPSEHCSECEDSNCELTCSHYICDDEQDELSIVECKACGKKIERIGSDDDDVYCFDCYLKNI